MSRFVLDGIHRGLECGACHGAGEKRRFRFGPQGDPEAADAFSCSGCHRAIASALRGDIAGRKVARSPHDGTVSCAECHDPASTSGPKPCSTCHPPDYDLLAVEWYARLEIERLRLHARGAAPEPDALREIRAHNWEGAAQWLRGEVVGSGSR